MNRLFSSVDILGQLVEERDGMYYRIDGVEGMEPFLMAVISDTDLWMWISSAGGLTAGRKNADGALFPYLTDDHLHRAAGRAGPITLVARTIDGVRQLWQPYSLQLSPQVTRSVAKHVFGHKVVFEEYHREWEMLFRSSWSPSREYGWVRECEIINKGKDAVEIELLDGLLDVMPSGIPAATEQSFSNLANAYKRSECGRWGTAAVFSMEALISDRTEPAEALSATVLWSAGYGFRSLALDERLVGLMARERVESGVRGDTLLTGRAGAYLLHDHAVSLAATGRCEWMIVCDVHVAHSEFARRFGDGGLFYRDASDDDAVAAVRAGINTGTERLRRLLGAADAFQQSGDAISDAHHLSNTLFNVMRGGVFPYDYRIPMADFMHFLRERNVQCYEEVKDALAAQGDFVEREELLKLATETELVADPCFERLVYEYLPLTFARRHGDPSRPWNRFEIEIEDAHGNELLSFQGNWRDIFQNWEALLYSFPHFIPHAVARFVNASTVDGHNPYRVTRLGFDWEAPDPNNPWSNIGYWGDHQIVYLFRLLKAWRQFSPTQIHAFLWREIFTYADTPYILADYNNMVRTPRNTITYDSERAAKMQERVERIGGDGQLMVDHKDSIARVNLMEKLLVPALAKMCSFVPHGGIWMNTQRPEWNDANNALAGFGLSMVTLYYLRQYIAFLDEILQDEKASSKYLISTIVALWLKEQSSILQRYADVDAQTDGATRCAIVHDLGRLASGMRNEMYRHFGVIPYAVKSEDIRAWCAVALRHLDATIATARRDDGLVHSYNLIRFVGDSAIEVEHLSPMLEGQVAALASGVLESKEEAELIDALYDSSLYRKAQDSFILYPMHMPQPFCERNSVPVDVLKEFPMLRGEEDAFREVFTVGNDAHIHFLPTMINAHAVEKALARIDVARTQREAVMQLYERMFQHHAYSGRSGSMHGYEGIGSIYWHMIGKLQLAVQECYWRARDRGEDEAVVQKLREAYRRVRAGLGLCKSPELFGAIPTDCYSHTPSHSGAQQPGMTGQVKEGILARIGELGIRVDGGRISFVAGLMTSAELLPGTDNRDGVTSTDEAARDGAEPERRARFSFCAVPFEIVPSAENRGEIQWRDGRRTATADGLSLTVEESGWVFARDERIACVRFYVCEV